VPEILKPDRGGRRSKLAASQYFKHTISSTPRHEILSDGAFVLSRSLNRTALRRYSNGTKSIPPSNDKALTPSENNLITLLSVVAGMTELIGYITLGNIFAAHITGNLVLAAASLMSTGSMNIAQVLTIPMFILAVAITWLIARLSRTSGQALVRLLLATEFAFLVGVLVFSGVLKPTSNLHGLLTGVAAMMAVGAMGCQFTLRRLCLPRAAATVVMTSNLADSVLSFVEAYRRPQVRSENIRPFEHYFRPVCGFAIGGISAAFAVYYMGNFAWVLPAAGAGIAIKICPRQIGR